MPSISEILLEKGRANAAQRLRSGERRAAIVTDLGRIPATIMADRSAAQQRQAAAQRQAAVDRRADAELAIKASGEQRALDADARSVAGEEQGRAAVASWIDTHRASIGDEAADRMTAIAQMPGGVAHIMSGLSQAPAPFTLNPGDVRYGADGKPIASNPKPVEPKAVTYGQPSPAMVGGRRVLIRPGSDGSFQTMEGVAPDVHPTAADNEPLVAIIGDNGKPVLVRRRDAVGKTPASTREQGRPVVSGDANRISDINNGLDDLEALRGVIAPRDKAGTLTEPGATGTLASIGAAQPAWLASLTGWTEPRQRQASIDRVKQVIGKTLEGGVLRKEDEEKYKKILPTIADTIEVVETKLNGLRDAIQRKRDNELDALEDAGYEVSRYRARAPHGSSQDGKIRARDEHGDLHEAAPGTVLPGGWTLEP